MDRILLNKMSFYAYHGVLPEENKLGQTFLVDLELRKLDLRPAGTTDQLTKSISYAEVYETVKQVTEENRFQLIEALAEHIAEAVLDKYQVPEVLVRVVKPNPPVAGSFESFGVEVIRPQ
jgi:dihydroneopterin aldolase